MSMMFFHFLKIIFDISTSKQSKKYKPYSILAKNKNEIWSNAGSTAEPNRLLMVQFLP
jgi:coenzyme F420-reducing hydrogenase beta subunit